jgi:membrane protease YdiL (CAAX protease family)
VAFLLLASVWCLLLAGGVLAPWLGSNPARVAAYAACGALLIWARPRARGRRSPFAAALVGTAGFAALPAWLALVWMLGSALGLARPGRAAYGAPDAWLWLANVALAPLFEELLHRERLLPALRRRIGAPLALLASSALFAAPHLEPWSLLTTFCVGLVLGGVFLAVGRVELCIAYHAGLNAAALVQGLPPARAALAPFGSALVGGLLLALACAWTRRRAACPLVHEEAGSAPRRRSRRARALHGDRTCPRSSSD